MQTMTLDLLITTFSYGGNGALASTHPDVMTYLVRLVTAAKSDERIRNVHHIDYIDTPITMLRNRAVCDARTVGADLLLMIDSDMCPDVHLKQNINARPFWESSLNFIYHNWARGPHVVGAPYCGPPPHAAKGGEENVYCFYWTNCETGTDNIDFRLDQYTRHEAEQLSGIMPCAALPTGLILFDRRAFDLVDPPWFYYDYHDDGEACPHCGAKKQGTQSRKCSTEDVVATRDISLNGQIKLKYNPVFCNWDAWAGHWKPKCVGKPRRMSVNHVSSKLARAVRENSPSNETLREVNYPFPVGMDPPANGRVGSQPVEARH